MKKLAFMFVAVVAMTLASCGNKAPKATETTDSVKVEQAEEVKTDSVEADSVQADSVQADSVK